MDVVIAYIGFGANLGDPVQQILDARKQLYQRDSITNISNSSLYLTSPTGYQDQPDFVNSVSSIETSLSAHALLSVVQEIENQLGRQRDLGNQNAPRLIDLDILLFGNETVSDEALVVPHPRLEQRLFTLEPLREIAPTLCWNESATVSDLLKQGYQEGRYSGQTIYRLT